MSLIDDIINDVCELPDYTSPDEQSDLLQCRVHELKAILQRRLSSETKAGTLSDPSPIDREWWKKQGIDACLDRMVLINQRRQELESRLSSAELEIEHPFDEAAVDRLAASTVAATSLPITDGHVYKDGAGELRLAVRWSDGTEIDRPLADVADMVVRSDSTPSSSMTESFCSTCPARP